MNISKPAAASLSGAPPSTVVQSKNNTAVAAKMNTDVSPTPSITSIVDTSPSDSSKRSALQTSRTTATATAVTPDSNRHRQSKRSKLKDDESTGLTTTTIRVTKQGSSGRLDKSNFDPSNVVPKDIDFTNAEFVRFCAIAIHESKKGKKYNENDTHFDNILTILSKAKINPLREFWYTFKPDEPPAKKSDIIIALRELILKRGGKSNDDDSTRWVDMYE